MSAKNFNRLDKVNSLLLQELNSLLQRATIENKNLKNDVILSITKIDTSKDLRHAKVFFSIMPLGLRGAAKDFLESKAFEWQKSLGKKITLKYIPKLHFVYDKGQENAATVEKILSDLNKNV